MPEHICSRDPRDIKDIKDTKDLKDTKSPAYGLQPKA